MPEQKNLASELKKNMQWISQQTPHRENEDRFKKKRVPKLKDKGGKGM